MDGATWNAITRFIGAGEDYDFSVVDKNLELAAVVSEAKAAGLALVPMMADHPTIRRNLLQYVCTIDERRDLAIEAWSHLSGDLLMLLWADYDRRHGKTGGTVVTITKTKLAKALGIGGTTVADRIKKEVIRLTGEHSPYAKEVTLDVFQFPEPQRTTVLKAAGMDTLLDATR